MDHNEYSYVPPKPKRPQLEPKKLKRRIILGVVVLLAVAIGTSCWYTVDEKEQAVVTTFGKVTDVTEAGIHFKLPLGIQQVQKVAVNTYQKIELGYRSDPYSWVMRWLKAKAR